MSMHAPTSDVEIVTRADLEAGERAAVASLGITYEELAECARRGAFPSERARLVWFMIAPDESVAC